MFIWNKKLRKSSTMLSPMDKELHLPKKPMIPKSATHPSQPLSLFHLVRNCTFGSTLTCNSLVLKRTTNTALTSDQLIQLTNSKSLSISMNPDQSRRARLTLGSNQKTNKHQHPSTVKSLTMVTSSSHTNKIQSAKMNSTSNSVLSMMSTDQVKTVVISFSVMVTLFTSSHPKESHQCQRTLSSQLIPLVQ